MTVDVQRKRYGGVAQVALHGLNVDAGADGRYRAAMTRVTITGVRMANDSHRLLCSGGIRLAWQMMAQRVGEHQIDVLPRENRQM